MIIDCHTHILPGIDDGAKDLDMSLEMLKEESKQGVDLIIATPHFYANLDRMDNFISRRAEAFEKLKPILEENPDFPKVKLGAEFAYFPGISKAEGIEQFCIEGTKTLLLEMPFCSWDDRVLKEVNSLVNDRGFNIVLVQIERYLGFAGQREKLELLLYNQVYLQVNAESLCQEGFFKKRKSAKLISWFEIGKVSLMGSDCHNLSSRIPNLNLGRSKLSKEALENIDEIAELLTK